MSTDGLPATHSPAQTLPPRRPSDRRNSTPVRWWRRGLLAIGLVAVLAWVAGLMFGAKSPQVTGSLLTHTITRGNLVVTVTEQGTLESSDNTEIKCKVRGDSTVIWVIEGGTQVQPGDELVRLDTLALEDAISERTKFAHLTRSGAERARADVASAELAIPEYLEGTYRAELMTLEKDLAIAESNLRTTQNMLSHAEMMTERGYVSTLEVEQKTLAVTQAELSVKAQNTAIDVLKNFTKAMELETLNGNLKATNATHDADKERAKQLAEQIVLCVADLENCVVKADRSGVVIYPTTEPWKYAPTIEQGATVYMGQTLLLMPDLSKMQVKVDIPESIVHRIKPGLPTRIALPDRTLEGQVSSVASVSAPTSRWTGNIVTYDTIIELPSGKRLKPGMSAEVEVIIDRHADVLTIPVAAVVETAEGKFCWVKSAKGAERRKLELGDSNDVHTIVQGGVQEGDEVFLNPLAFEQTAAEVPKPLDKAALREPDSVKSDTESKRPEPSSDQAKNDS